MTTSQRPKKRGYRQLLWLFLCLLAPLGLRGQEPPVEFLSFEMMIGDTFYYEFENIPPYNPQLANYTVYPKHGQAGFPFSGPLGSPTGDTLGYVPTVNYPVTDTIYLKYWTFVGPAGTYNTTLKIIEIKVLPGIVHAEDDYAETTMNTPIDIDVLFNDYTNVGEPRVAEVPLVNYGTVSLSNDSTLVTFTPAQDFTGIAHFNYTIEGANNTFDMASVNVYVKPPSEPVFESYTLSTAKETAKAILYSLDGYHLAQAPAHGSLDSTSMDYLLYTPDAGFFNARDTFLYEKTENGVLYQKEFVIDVMDIPLPNTFVFDDFAYTTRNTPVLIDVRANDLNTSGSVPVVVQPQHGQVSYVGNGIYQYTPDQDFEGLDEFVYRGMVGGVFEYATVYLTVSDYLPSQGTFLLSTPKNTPLVIGYNIPVYNYDFTVTVNPLYGTAEFFPGNQTLTINGQTFSGYNMLIYTPNTGVAGITDEFEIEYCVSSSNCPTAQVKIDVNILDIDPPASHFCLADNCIWPGDANNDGAVTMEDILPLGLAMGEVGLERPEPDLSVWYGQYGDDWNNVRYDLAYDLKFVDTDGDGIIAGVDTVAISQFYLKKHALVPAPTAPPITVPLYFFQTSQTPVAGGDLIHLDIWLGKPDAELAEDIYGFTFSMQYEADLVPEESVHIDFLPQSWVTYNSPVLHMTQKPYAGRIDAGFTRTSGYSDDGYGIVATMEFVIIEDIDGTRLRDQYLDLYFTSGTIMTASGATYSLPEQHLKIPLNLIADEDANLPELVLSPNPASMQVRLHLNQSEDDAFKGLSLYTPTGQLVFEMSNFSSEVGRDYWLNVSDLHPGVYIVKVRTEKGFVLTQKLEVLR